MVSSDGNTGAWWIGKDLEVSDPGPIGVLYQNLLGVTEETHKNPRSE
jgi:hypothetical protein